ncbi:uncharacterized protein TNCV_3175631 [Trichonephila clavipes]|nr:uncharacterized protein TNCV_3175631 [Trichonephila clavipes]
MDDGTYMPFYDVPTRQERKVWVFEVEPMPTMVKSQRAMKKVKYAVFFRSTGLIKVIKFEGQNTVTANWYTTKCLPEILQEVNVGGLMLHHDSASSHTAGLAAEFLKHKQTKVIDHPPYYPDRSMCDFWLFIYLKKTYVDVVFIQKKTSMWLQMRFPPSIPRNEWFQAFNLWKILIQKCIDAGEDYFEHS